VRGERENSWWAGKDLDSRLSPSAGVRSAAEGKGTGEGGQDLSPQERQEAEQDAEEVRVALWLHCVCRLLLRAHGHLSLVLLLALLLHSALCHACLDANTLDTHMQVATEIITFIKALTPRGGNAQTGASKADGGGGPGGRGEQHVLSRVSNEGMEGQDSDDELVV